MFIPISAWGVLLLCEDGYTHVYPQVIHRVIHKALDYWTMLHCNDVLHGVCVPDGVCVRAPGSWLNVGVFTPISQHLL